jgi:tRNA pseudouridine38-40 synthase
VLAQLFAQPVKVTGAGRTDAGVHAAGQVISFGAHDRFQIDKLAIAMNSLLPRDLSARDPSRVEDGFSARAAAIERRYVYAILNRRDPSAILRRFAHHEHRTLDLDAMRAGAAHLLGEHDFLTFCGVLPERGGTLRRVDRIDIVRNADVLCIDVRGAGFLHRMVRIIVGTLLDVGAGRRVPDDVRTMLEARDPQTAGPTAPPEGLVLAGVRYSDFDSEPPGFGWPPSGLRLPSLR